MAHASLRHRFPGAADGWARFDGPSGTQVVDSAIAAMTTWLTDGSNGCGGNGQPCCGGVSCDAPRSCVQRAGEPYPYCR